MNHLLSLLTPVMMQKMFQLFENVKDVHDGKSILRRFQDSLREIPNWNQHVVDSETQLMTRQTEPGLLEDLITTIMVSNAEILSTINVVATTNKINLKIPKISVFIHNCYIELARKLYKHVFLFADDISNTDRQKNLQAIEALTGDAIKLAVQKALPVHDIIKQYVTGGGDAKTAHEALDNIQDPDVARALIEEGKQNNPEDNDADKIAVVKEDDIKEIQQPDDVVLGSLSLLDENGRLENAPSEKHQKNQELAKTPSETSCEDYIAPEDDIRPPDEDVKPLSIDDIFIVEPTVSDSDDEDGRSATGGSRTTEQKEQNALGNESDASSNDTADEDRQDQAEHEQQLDDGSEHNDDHDDIRDTTNKVDNVPSHDTETTAPPSPADELEIYFTDDDEEERDTDPDDVDLTLGNNTASDSEAEDNTDDAAKSEDRHDDSGDDAAKNDDKEKSESESHRANSSQESSVPITTQDVQDSFASPNDDFDDEDLIEYDDNADDILPLPSEETSDLTDSDMEGISFTDDDLYSDQEEVDDMLSSLTRRNQHEGGNFPPAGSDNVIDNSKNEEESISSDNQPKKVSKLEAFIGELAPKSCYKDKSDDDIPFPKKTKSKPKPKTPRRNNVVDSDDESDKESDSVQRRKPKPKKQDVSAQKPKPADPKEKIELFADAASDSD